MKGILVRQTGGPEVMRLETLPDPSPGPGQVVVRVRAAGVNPVDTYIRSGAYGRKPDLPYTPGRDGAGEVEAVGAGVTRHKPGDRVYVATLSGTYAEKVACPAEAAHPLPDQVTYEQGAAIGVPYGTAYRAIVQRAKAQARDTLLVHGASGGVGTAAVQIASALGMTVFGTAGTKEGRERALKDGCAHALDHKAPDYLETFMELTGGRGADVILEMLANVNLGKDLGVLAPGGRVVVIGSRGPVEIDPRAAMGKDASILGMSLHNITPADYARVHAALSAGLKSGTLKPVVGRELPLAEAPRSHAAVLEPGALGKIVLLP
ncbi:MAG: NADPH:quinone reductase [Proteobacteria bacterium]|nr:NADPH:quinone reductase [Pseudomonadota bacterium]